MWPFDHLAKDWPLISAAPTSAILFAIAAFGVAFLAAKLWHRRKEEILESEKRLAEKERDIYKVEADNIRKKLDETHAFAMSTQTAPVAFGNEAVRSLFLKLSENPNQAITIYQQPRAEQEAAEYAASKRLEEAGIAKIDVQTPTTSSVVSAVNVDDLKDIFDVALKAWRDKG